MELPGLYRQMLRVRSFELAVADLWSRGLISGEMHLATGEEAVAAGVVTHLRGDDGLALTHRCSPALVVRGVSQVDMLKEMLGRQEGLCGGRAGHMHLCSKRHRVAASGIVGASLPLMLVFAIYQEPIWRRVNREPITEEIVRTLVGSVGLILAVPITGLIASLMARWAVRRDRREAVAEQVA